MTNFSFQLQRTDGGARLGEMATAHGTVRTPAFMPVGTVATVFLGIVPEPLLSLANHAATQLFVR